MVTKRKIAAPSFIWPAGIAENCTRLAQIVPEVSLLFFETESCLAYTHEDLPPFLADIGLRFHVHLPLDLPWEESPAAAWEAVFALQAKSSFLRPWSYVLHPPPNRVCPEQKNGITTHFAPDRLREFLVRWAGASLAATLLLENTRENDLVELWPVVRSFGVGVCLDLGHLLAFGQETDNIPGIWPHVGMVHLSAPGPAGEHRSLRLLDEVGRARLENILAHVGPDCVFVLEVFNPEDFQESLTFLRERGFLSPS